MTENKRFTVKPQNDLFGVNDNTAEYNVVNGIPTKIEAELLCDTLNSLHKENEELKQCIDNMGGRLQGLWAHYNANRYEIWGRAVEDVAKELGFKIYKPGDAAISMSDLKKERINSVKKLNKRLRDLGVVIE